MFDAQLNTRYIHQMSEHSLLEAESNLSELIDRAIAGEGVVITREGRPVVELRPVQQPAKAPQPRLSGAEMLAWLRANRVPTRAKTDAGQLVSALRDEGEH